MARTINFEFRKGSGAPVEIMFGEVTLTPTLMHSVGTSAVIPAPTKADLVDGKASMPNVAPTPAPVAGQVEWAYKVVVKDRHGKQYEWLVGVPDALPAINFVTLPRYYETKPPIYGEGPPGPAGTAATFAVGTVTSGPTPAITNSGTSTNAVLNFTLAKGDKGDTGVGVPTGGSALQVVRKNAANTTTEWATLPNATQTVPGLMSPADKTLIDTATLSPIGNTLVKRHHTGALQAVTGASGQDVVNRDFLNTALTSKQDASTLASSVMDITRPVREAVSDAADPLAYLDNVSLVARFPVREAGEVSWPQGFSINLKDNELYVANQNGTELRIDVRNLASGERKSSKKFTTEAGAFSESLTWWYNSSNQLCFMVWPKNGGASPSSYAIANYTLGTIGAQIPIYGFWRGDSAGGVVITSDAWTYSVSKFYVYDFESIKAGNPNLLDTILLSNPGNVAVKNQGLGAGTNAMYLTGGEQFGVPGVTVFDRQGNTLASRTYSKPAFQAAVNALTGGWLTDNNYFYEGEGACVVGGKLHTAHVVDNTPGGSTTTSVLILRHGDIGGARMDSVGGGYTPAMKNVGEWVSCVPESGWAHTVTPLQARVRSGQVEFRGYATNATFVGGYSDAFTLPPEIPRPLVYTGNNVPGNTSAIRSAEVSPAGKVRFYTSAATASWYSLGVLTYPLN